MRSKSMQLKSGIAFGALLGLLGVGAVAPVVAQGDQQKKLPASNVLGGEDIWTNPTFTSGTGNNGETASSEW